ncbi:MAG: hypothetical protein WAW52_11840 [Methanothrix sp.]
MPSLLRTPTAIWRYSNRWGVDGPNEKLKRALRAEIDEEAWAALYSTKSMPVDVPDTENIAMM